MGGGGRGGKASGVQGCRPAHLTPGGAAFGTTGRSVSAQQHPGKWGLRLSAGRPSHCSDDTPAFEMPEAPGQRWARRPRQWPVSDSVRVRAAGRPQLWSLTWGPVCSWRNPAVLPRSKATGEPTQAVRQAVPQAVGLPRYSVFLRRLPPKGCLP